MGFGVIQVVLRRGAGKWRQVAVSVFGVLLGAAAALAQGSRHFSGTGAWSSTLFGGGS